MVYLLLVLGFVLVIKGADWLVDGASSLAKRLKVSDLAIGLTVVAFGTSMPEFVVNIFSSLNKTPEIAIGNILGSNIANTFLILGVAAIIYPIAVQKKTTWKEIPFSLLAAAVVGILANDIFFGGGTVSSLSRGDGLILIAFFIIFMYYTFGSCQDTGEQPETSVKEMGLLKALGLILVGLVCLSLGGNWIVEGAIKFAQMLGVSASLIGLTVVAVGTSLPELVTSAVAAWKKNSDIAIGNVVGSNIFNIFWVLGASAIIYPLPFSPANSFDVLMVVFASLVLFAIMFIGKKHTIQRWQGVTMILLYVAYISFLVYRG